MQKRKQYPINLHRLFFGGVGGGVLWYFYVEITRIKIPDEDKKSS